MREKFNKAPYLLFLLIFPVLGYTYRLLNTHSIKPTILLTGFDSALPFLPVFILPYILWYGFIVGYLVYFCFKDTQVYIKTLFIIVVGELICFIIYFFFQTTVPRPILEEKGIIIDLVQLIYNHDQPYNCFPSIHVLTTFAIILGSIHIKNKHLFHSIFIPFLGTMIIISTLFVKQHGILDIFGSIFIDFIIYGVVFEYYQYLKISKPKPVYSKDGM